MEPYEITNNWPFWVYKNINFRWFHLQFCFTVESFPGSGSFPMSQFFTLGGLSIGASASASVLPVTIQSLFPVGLTGLISLLSKGLLRVFSPAPQFESINSSVVQPSLWSNSHICTWLPGKLWLWLDRPLLAKWCLCFLIHCLGLSKFSFQEASAF